MLFVLVCIWVVYRAPGFALPSVSVLVRSRGDGKDRADWAPRWGGVQGTHVLVKVLILMIPRSLAMRDSLLPARSTLEGSEGVCVAVSIVHMLRTAAQ